MATIPIRPGASIRGIIRAAVAEARRHMRVRRLRLLTLIVALAGIAAVSIELASTSPQPSPSARALPLAPASGSTAMPASFVATGSGSGLGLMRVDSHTGAVTPIPLDLGVGRVLKFGGVVADATTIYFFEASAATPRDPLSEDIYALPLTGGVPIVLVHNVGAVALALSPDHRWLAWVSEPSPPLTSGMVTVTVRSLLTGDGRSMRFPMPEGGLLTTTGRPTSDHYMAQVTGFTWMGDTRLAVTTGIYGDFSSASGKLLTRRPSRIANPLPRVTLLSVNGGAPQTLVIPIQSGFECPISDFMDRSNPFLIGLSSSNLLGYVVSRSGAGDGCAPYGEIGWRPLPHLFALSVKSGAELVRLHVTSDQVLVSRVGSLPLGVEPVDLDAHGDLLVSGVATSGAVEGGTFLGRLVAGDHVLQVSKPTKGGLAGMDWTGASW